MTFGGGYLQPVRSVRTVRAGVAALLQISRAAGQFRKKRSVEEKCGPYCAERKGRPSIPPDVYFRMLFLGYFEGLGSERGIAWKVKDSLSLRAFIGYDLSQDTPDHSSGR